VDQAADGVSVSTMALVLLKNLLAKGSKKDVQLIQQEVDHYRYGS